MIRTERVIQWMNYIREHPDHTEFLECFWESQLTSKEWLLNNLPIKALVPGINVTIFGGWYGILAQLLIDRFPYLSSIDSIDINPFCAFVGSKLSNNSRIGFETEDMAEYKYPLHPHIVINTSTEHVDQATYEMWFDKIPSHAVVAIQGNNLYENPQHVRCTPNLEKFKFFNRVEELDIKMEGTLKCGHFDRYMVIGLKR